MPPGVLTRAVMPQLAGRCCAGPFHDAAGWHALTFETLHSLHSTHERLSRRNRKSQFSGMPGRARSTALARRTVLGESTAFLVHTTAEHGNLGATTLNHGGLEMQFLLFREESQRRISGRMRCELRTSRRGRDTERQPGRRASLMARTPGMR